MKQSYRLIGTNDDENQIPPNPPLAKGGTYTPPLEKGGRGDFQNKNCLTLFFLSSCCLFFLIATLSGCSSKEEIAPFEDGLYLTYKKSISGPIGGKDYSVQVNFTEVENGRFKITIEQDESSPVKIEIEDDSLYINKFGKMIGGQYLTIDADKAPIWAPVYKMKKGGRFMNGYIREKIRWKDWNVWVVEQKLPGTESKWYFEENTGYLIGSEMSGMGAGFTSILTRTNAKGL